MKPSRWSFLDRKQTRRLGVEVINATRRPRGRMACPGGRPAAQPRGPLVAPSTYFFRLYILLYPENIRESHEATFPLPQPSIPVRSLFRRSAGGGFDRGARLHQHHSLSDDVWVVYHRPLGPYLLARWLLLSLWFSIKSSARCSWRSIRCNTFCGVFVEIRWILDLWSSLSMNNIWFFSEFLCMVWYFLQWENCLALGSILRCPFPVTIGATRNVLYCCHRG